MLKKIMMVSLATSYLLIGANAQQASDSIYKKVHRDWTVECFSVPASNDPKVKTPTKECQMFQQATMVAPADKGKPANEQRTIPILRTSITLFDNNPVMIFAAPLDVQLSEGLQLRLNKNDDSDDAKIFITVKGEEDGKEKEIKTDIAQINFERCSNFGCIAALPMDVDIKNELLEKFVKGNNLFVNFTFDASAPKNSELNIKTKVPLTGFSTAYDDLVAQLKD